MNGPWPLLVLPVSDLSVAASVQLAPGELVALVLGLDHVGRPAGRVDVLAHVEAKALVAGAAGVRAVGGAGVDVGAVRLVVPGEAGVEGPVGDVQLVVAGVAAR